MKLRIGLRPFYSSYGRITSTKPPSFCLKTVKGRLTLHFLPQSHDCSHYASRWLLAFKTH